MTKQAPQRVVKKFVGIVVSSAMDKTCVVQIDRVKRHPKYQKTFTVSKRYLVHDEHNKYHEGDSVTFVECRPLSRQKRWRVLYENK